MNNLNKKIVNTKCKEVDDFFQNRFNDTKKYRGINFSTQNRFNFKIIKELLKLLCKYDGNNYLEVLVGDDHDKKTNNLDDFNKYVAEIKKNIGHGTKNSIKKNYFTEMYRIGFIRKYDHNKKEILSKSRSNYRYIQISNDGKKLLSLNRKKQQLFYEKSIKKLFPNNFLENLQKLLKILPIDEHNLKEILALFITAIDQTFSGKKYSYKNIKSLLKKWFKIPKNIREDSIQKIREWCNNKIAKSSYSNLLNQSQQAIDLLKQLPWFKKNVKNKSSLHIDNSLFKFSSKKGIITNIIDKEMTCDNYNNKVNIDNNIGDIKNDNHTYDDIAKSLPLSVIETIVKKRTIENVEIRNKLKKNIFKKIIGKNDYWSDFKNVVKRYIDDLEACHIKEVSTIKKQNHIDTSEYFNYNNGLMMNPDAHSLFDKKIFTFSPIDGKILLKKDDVESKKRIAIAFKVDINKVDSIQIKRLTKEMSFFLKQREK